MPVEEEGKPVEDTRDEERTEVEHSQLGQVVHREQVDHNQAEPVEGKRVEENQGSLCLGKPLL